MENIRHLIERTDKLFRERDALNITLCYSRALTERRWQALYSMKVILEVVIEEMESS